MLCKNKRLIVGVVQTVIMSLALLQIVASVLHSSWIYGIDKESGTEVIDCAVFQSNLRCDQDVEKYITCAGSFFSTSIAIGIISIILQYQYEFRNQRATKAIVITGVTITSWLLSLIGLVVYFCILGVFAKKYEVGKNSVTFQLNGGILIAIDGTCLLFIAAILSCIVPCLKPFNVVMVQKGRN